MLGGAMQCLGFAGFSLWPFALVCWLPMFYVIDTESTMTPRRALALGWVHGFVAYAGGYYWLVEMLENFSGYDGVVNWFFASVFFAFQGCQQMLLYWVFRRVRRRGYGVTMVAIPALLTLEHLFPMLFPAYLATGFHNVPVAIQIADLGGPMLVSAVAMAFNGAVYEAARAFLGKRAYPRRLLALVGVVVCSTLIYGAARIAWIDSRAAEADQLDVGMVQVNMGIFAKREEPFEGHRRHLEQSRQLEREHPELDLLVWPESAFTFFLREGTTNVRHHVLSGLRTPTLFGGLARRTVDGQRKHYNTAYLADENGEIVGTYDKTYLLAFGEYMPFGEMFPILYEWSPNSGHFTPGNHVRPLQLGGLRISTLVCYEDVLPRFTRSAVQEGNPHLLVNITNDAWFGDTQEPWIHLALAKFRAVEHHRALVRTTNSGVSAFVDPVGRVISTIDVGVRDEQVAQLPLLDGWTPYQSAGDWPGWLGFLFLICIGWIRQKESTAPKTV